jgi:hypothetical protein
VPAACLAVVALMRRCCTVQVSGPSRAQRMLGQDVRAAVLVMPDVVVERGDPTQHQTTPALRIKSHGSWSGWQRGCGRPIQGSRRGLKTHRSPANPLVDRVGFEPATSAVQRGHSSASRHRLVPPSAFLNARGRPGVSARDGGTGRMGAFGPPPSDHEVPARVCPRSHSRRRRTSTRPGQRRLRSSPGHRQVHRGPRGEVGDLPGGHPAS